MTQSYVTLGLAPALLQLARIKAGISQTELAWRAGVPATMVSAYEHGRRDPGLGTLTKLLGAAGFELRMHLEPTDTHDAVLAAREALRSPAERRQLDRQLTAWRRASKREGEALVRGAHQVDVDGVPVLVADLDNVIRSKEAAGRPKDIRALPALYRHRAARDHDPK